MTELLTADFVDKQVALLWPRGTDPEQIRLVATNLQEKVGPNGKLLIENVDRLKICKFSSELCPFLQKRKDQ